MAAALEFAVEKGYLANLKGENRGKKKKTLGRRSSHDRQVEKFAQGSLRIEDSVRGMGRGGEAGVRADGNC